MFHFEAIQDLQDECPLILCYSKQSGTGRHMPYVCNVGPVIELEVAIGKKCCTLQFFGIIINDNYSQNIIMRQNLIA